MSDTASEHHLNATVAVRKSIANFVWTQRLQTEATWPSSIPRTTATESVVESSKRHFLVCPVPVDEDVYSKPHLFLPWLKINQTYMSDVVYIREPVAQAFASKVFVHRKLEELPFVETLGSKAKRSLEVNVHNAINLKRAFIKTKKLRSLEPQDVELVQQVIKTIQGRIADGTFAPDKYTDPRGARMFTLLPVFSTQDKNIRIDAETAKDPRKVADFTSRELEALGQYRAAAKFRLEAMAENDKIKWDTAIRPLDFELGDMVLMTNEGAYGLEPKWEGPYIVVASYPDYGTYKLETLQGEPLNSLVHVDRLKLAHTSNATRPTFTWYEPSNALRRAPAETLSYFTSVRPMNKRLKARGGGERLENSHHSLLLQWIPLLHLILLFLLNVYLVLSYIIQLCM